MASTLVFPETILPGGEPSDAPRASFSDSKATVAFMLAGNAHVTFQSERTGAHYTYHVALAPRRTDGSPVTHFVAVLTGADSYEYVGFIRNRAVYVHGGHRSRIARTAKSHMAFGWTWAHLTAGRMPETLTVWHEGRCGKCGRRLTDPESIASGLGPICGGRS